MFEQTLQHIASFASPTVVCHVSHLSLVQQQCQKIDVSPRTILLEPQSRGTAAALASAALSLKDIFPNAILLVLPADLVINDQPAFEAAVQLALPQAQQGKFVTFGIKPTHPEPRYGYIETGNCLKKDVYEMKRFMEKPSLETATQWMEQEKYFWNSGMFLLPLEKLLEQLQTQQDALFTACSKTLQKGKNTGEIIFLDETSFAQAPKISFETAVMEHVQQGVMVHGHFDWGDAGTWQALWELQAKNPQSNICHGNTRVENSSGCYVHATSRRISVLGCEDIVIVETADEVLVTTRQAAGQISRFTKE